MVLLPLPRCVARVGSLIVNGSTARMRVSRSMSGGTRSRVGIVVPRRLRISGHGTGGASFHRLTVRGVNETRSHGHGPQPNVMLG